MSDKFLFGIPVSGDLYEETPAVTQRPIEDLEPVFRALIEDPNVHSFGWTQYTPYFNDGDTCEFGVREPWLRTVDDVDDESKSDYEFEISKYHPTLGTERSIVRDLTPEEIEKAKAAIRARNPEWYSRHEPHVATYTYDTVEREAKYPGTTERAEKLFQIQNYEFEYAMKQTFGDHAEVTVTKDGITIDEYSHD